MITGTGTLRTSGAIFSIVISGIVTVNAQGNVGIGIDTPIYTLDISGQGERVLNVMNNSTVGGLKTGICIENNATESGGHYGIANFLTGQTLEEVPVHKNY